MSNIFRTLTVQKIVEETPDSKSLFFEIPEEYCNDFEYQPGQYITVKVMANDKEERRAYSIFTSPIEDVFGVTVKKVEGGIVSNYLCDKVNEGDQLEIMNPEGRFIFEAEADKEEILSFSQVVVELHPYSPLLNLL